MPTKPDFFVPLSDELKRAVKNSGRPQYKVGLAVGFKSATVFSEILSGRRLVEIGDLRVLKLAEMLGVPFPFDMSKLRTTHV